MLPALQPHRPKVPPPNRAKSSNPFHQEQTRPGQTYPSHQPPKSQIEALSPFVRLEPSLLSAQPISLSCLAGQYDPAVRDPVFFTERLRKAGTASAGVSREGVSPVAKRYALVDWGSKELEDGAVNRRTKL